MKLFTPFTLGSTELKNRIVMAPMCMYMADEDGFAKPFHQVHYATRAYGGVGFIITEATAVEPRGRISANDLGIWDDAHIEGLQSIVNSVHHADAKIGIQLAHAGRKCGIRDHKSVSASPIPFSEQYSTPKELTTQEIKEVINAFQTAAVRANKAGFDVIELHAAHGYLINQFISPLTNRRNDEYGGSLKNRIRFLEEVIHAVRQVWNKTLLVRFSAEEYAKGGHSIEDTKEVIRQILPTIDGVNVSSGAVVPVSMDVYPLYQIPFAREIHSLPVATIGGGLVTTFSQIEDILSNKDCDLIYLGRELLRNPYFVLHAAKEAEQSDHITKAYKRGFS